MKEKLQAIKAEALRQIESAEQLEKLNDNRVAFLGKRGELTEVLKSMKNFAPEERPAIGALVNEVRDALESKISEEEAKFKEKESIALNLCLYVLSGTIFGCIWRYTLISESQTFKTKKNTIINYIVSILLFPYTSYLMYKTAKVISKKCNEIKDYSILVFILGLIGLSVVSYAILQKQINKVSDTNNE